MIRFVCTLTILANAYVAAQDTGAIVTDPTPGHGVVPCGSQLVDIKHYTCFDNRVACPAPKTQLCGVDACYNPAEYHCVHDQLVQGKDVTHKSISGLSGLSEHAGLSGSADNYGIVVPGPGAYEQLLADLGRTNIHMKQIDQIKDILNTHGFELTSPQVAVILRNPHGAKAALEQFGDTLNAQDATNLEKAMPQIDIVLAAVGQTKTGPARPVPGPGMSGISRSNSSTSNDGTSNDLSGTSVGNTTPALSGQAMQLMGSATVLAVSAMFGAALVLYF